MSAAPALSRSVSHVDQGLPVAFSTAAEPMPLSLPVDCGFSGVAVGVPLGPGFPGVFAADLAARGLVVLRAVRVAVGMAIFPERCRSVPGPPGALVAWARAGTAGYYG